MENDNNMKDFIAIIFGDFNTSKKVYDAMLTITPVVESENLKLLKKAVTEAAEKAMMEKNYHAAVSYYDDLLKFDTMDAKIVYKNAEAARASSFKGSLECSARQSTIAF
jgi:hypothetical protein